MKLKKKKTSQILSINSKIGRNINRSIILNAIRSNQPISRATISKMTGLNKSTVSGIVFSLLHEGLIEEGILKNQIVGRNPLNLTIKKHENYVGAIFFDSLQTQIAIVDVDGTLIVQKAISVESNNPSERIQKSLQELMNLHPVAVTQALRGIGVVIPGIVDATLTKVVYSSNLGWQNVEIGESIRSLYPRIEHITIENDAKSSALAELIFGTHKVDRSNFVFLSVGSGISAGVVINNHILSGSSNAVGEYGHMMLIENGKQCSCGNKGCWEMYASENAIINLYNEQTKTHNTGIEEILSLALNGDVTALNALSSTAKYLGLGISNIVRMFDPQYVIIGGRIIRAWLLIQPIIENILTLHSYHEKENTKKIIPSSLHQNPSLLGAAALSIQKIFMDYKIAL